MKIPLLLRTSVCRCMCSCPRLQGGVSAPESWGSGRVFSGSQARRGSGSGEVSQDRGRPRTLSLCLLRHAALANLLRSAILWHKEMHMAASDAWRPLHPALGSSQKTGIIPGVPWDFLCSRVGIALCKMKAPFQSSVGLISLNFTQHLPSGMGHLQI